MKCIVISPIHVRGARIERGAEVDLDLGQYDRLRAAECVRTVEEHETLVEAEAAHARAEEEAEKAAAEAREQARAKAREDAERKRREAELEADKSERPKASSPKGSPKGRGSRRS